MLFATGLSTASSMAWTHYTIHYVNDPKNYDKLYGSARRASCGNCTDSAPGSGNMISVPAHS